MSIFWRIWKAQAWAALAAFGLAGLLWPQAALSALLGGLACLIPGLYLLLQQARPDAPAGSGLGRALKGEAGRVALTVAIFAGVFAGYKALSFLAFLGVFAGLQVFYGLVPLLDARRESARARTMAAKR